MKKIDFAALIPPKCMSNLAMGLVAITVFVWGLVIPGRMNMVRLDRRIQAARLKLDERNRLLPLYEALKKASLEDPMKSKSQSGAALLAAPAKAGLKQADLGAALLQIRALSAQSEMKAVTVKLDLKNAFGGAKSVAVDVSCEGGFADFRTFLVDLCALPYVEDIAHIYIRRAPRGRALDFDTKIMLAMS